MVVTKTPSKNDIPVQQVVVATCLKYDRQMSSKNKDPRRRSSQLMSQLRIWIFDLEEILNMSIHKNLKVNKDSKKILRNYM